MAFASRRYSNDPDYSHSREVNSKMTLSTLIAVAFESLVIYKSQCPYALQIFQSFTNALLKLSGSDDDLCRQTSFFTHHFYPIFYYQNMNILDTFLSSSDFSSFLIRLVAYNELRDENLSDVRYLSGLLNIDLRMIWKDKILYFRKSSGIRIDLKIEESSCVFKYAKISNYSCNKRDFSFAKSEFEIRFRYTVEEERPIFRSEEEKQRSAVEEQKQRSAVEEEKSRLRIEEGKKKKCEICDLFESIDFVVNKWICAYCIHTSILNRNRSLLHFGMIFSPEENLRLVKVASNRGHITFVNKCVVCLDFGKNVCYCMCPKHFDIYNNNNPRQKCNYCNSPKQNFSDFKGKEKCDVCSNSNIKKQFVAKINRINICFNCAYNMIRENGYYNGKYERSYFISLALEFKIKILKFLKEKGFPIKKMFGCSICKSLNMRCFCFCVSCSETKENTKCRHCKLKGLDYT